MKTKKPDVLSPSIAASIIEIVEYLWHDEQKHYREHGSSAHGKHIFESLANVRLWLKSNEN